MLTISFNIILIIIFSHSITLQKTNNDLDTLKENVQFIYKRVSKMDNIIYSRIACRNVKNTYIYKYILNFHFLLDRHVFTNIRIQERTSDNSHVTIDLAKYFNNCKILFLSGASFSFFIYILSIINWLPIEIQCYFSRCLWK